jgi:HYDIN/CFA65/VesB-like, Ig-like domain
MIIRILLSLSLLPLSALAQLQIFQFDGTNYTALGPVVNVGTAAPGDTIVTRFRVRNMSAGPVVVQNVSLSGEDFMIQPSLSLPYTLAPYVGPASELEIDTLFSPTLTATFSATLALNNVSLVLTGTSAPTATVMLAGTATPLAAGSTVNFGSVPIGSKQTQGFVLSNLGEDAVTVPTLSVSGSGFSGPIGLSAPVLLSPGQTATFQVTFTPQTGSPEQGVLTVGSRTFALAGQGLSATLPAATIVFASTVGASAQQDSLTISLASPSQVNGTGTLTMSFQSTVDGVTDDPAIQFLTGKLREASVSISSGDTSAKIGGQPGIAFQTGTTAGTITFTLTLNGGTPQQATLNIAPSPIILDSFTAVRQLGSLGIAFGGFDNTYSASQISFTFYDLKGLTLPQGAINVDAAGAFQQYFSATQAGGSFALLATFPVSGDTTQIGFVMATITNSAGTTTAQQIAIQN